MIDATVLVQNYEVLYSGTACRIESVTPRSDGLYVRFIRPGYGGYDYLFHSKTLVALGHEGENMPIRIRKKARSVARDVWFLRVGQESWDKNEWLDTEKFTEISEAKLRLAEVKEKFAETDSPFLVRLRKDTEMAEVADYDQWAAYRFESGEWTKLPWANEPWLKPEIENVHFGHMSLDNDCSVAYWQDAAQAQKDRISTMSGGRYLERFYSDVLTAAEIESWVHKLDPPGELVFSGSDPEAIYQAYDAGPGSSGLNSCMTYRDTQDCHDGVRWQCDGKSPVRVYGAGDLEVATLVRHGRRVGRALVWRERKAVGRIYGDFGRMKAALMAAGFEHDGNWTANDMHTTPRGLFNGARILKIEPENQEGNVMMPYIDFSYGVNDAGDHFTLSYPGGYKSHRTDGLLRCPENDGSACDRCGEYDDPDEMYTIGDQSWCYSCYDNHSRTCDRCGESVATNQLIDVDGSEWCPPCAEHDSTVCDHCHERTRDDNVTAVHDARGNVSGSICDDCAPDEDNSDFVMINGRVFDADALLENA